MQITLGISENDRDRVAELFWLGFKEQIEPIFGSEEAARRYIAKNLRPCRTLCARDRSGRIVGIAGFHVDGGGLIELSFMSMLKTFGPVKALWRVLKLHRMDHRKHPTSFAIEGICVEPSLRGRGIGSAILFALERQAILCGRRSLSLKVLNVNTGAIRLYERQGYQPVKPKFGEWCNFERATLMVRNLT